MSSVEANDKKTDDPDKPKRIRKQEKKNHKCKKCGEIFDSDIKFLNHRNRLVPCDYHCRYCNIKYSKSAYYRHRKDCNAETYKQKKLEEEAKQLVNAPQNNVNQDNSATLNNQNNNNNSVMLAPFGLEHLYMNREETMGSCRGEVKQSLLKYDFPRAYEVIFENVHGNEKFPQFHNICMTDLNSNEIVAFSGKRFKHERRSYKLPDVLKFLKFEMKWLVRTDSTLTDEQKSQMCWDIQNNWSTLDDQNDENMKRILFNNKAVVHKTITTRKVYPDVKIMAKFKKVKPESIKTDGLPIKLPFEM
jgi:hypothetical protein